MTDTIAALATPPGPGALSVVRVSGPAAPDVLRAVCPELDSLPEPRRATLVRLRDPTSAKLLDRAVLTFFRGPASYTGEDLLEISCHGGWMAPALVLDACLEAGARRAEAGEFTRRAYLNGKMDLLQAEAVLDLVEGRNLALHDAALGQLERGLSNRVSDLRARLVQVEALLVHHLDFPEEDDAPAPVERVAAEADGVADALDALVRTAPEGELLRAGALTVIAGRPNTGKSSLFNALLGHERAIVTELPGTTRDAVEAGVALEGFPFRLVDTAGLREDAERVERLGIEVAERFLAQADVVLLCAEASSPWGGVEQSFLDRAGAARVVVVRTKADLLGDPPASTAPERLGETPGTGLATVEVSTVTGQGLERLRQLLPSLVFQGLVRAPANAPILTRRRQARRAERAREEIRAFARALRGGVPAEVAGTHLRSAETELEELLGVIQPDEVLDRVFSEFCIGK